VPETPIVYQDVELLEQDGLGFHVPHRQRAGLRRKVRPARGYDDPEPAATVAAWRSRAGSSSSRDFRSTAI
jgi:hypothetical protein